MYGLEQALFSICEEGSLDFTDFLQSRRTQPNGLSQATADDLRPEQVCILLGERFSSGVSDRHSRQIPLQKKSQKRSSHSTVIYTSAVPQILFANDSFFQSLTLPEISQIIVDKLQKVMSESTVCEPDHNSCDLSSASQIWHELKIETHRSGWIGFHLSQTGIGLWLAHCINQYDIGIVLDNKQVLMHLRHHKFPKVSEALMWRLQYAHARCCHLLRLWHQVYANSAIPSLTLQFDSNISSDSRLIDWPWLETNREQTELVHSLIEVTDHMFWIPYQWHSKQYFLLLEHATALYQALERFYAVRLSGFPTIFQSDSQSDAIASIQKFQAQSHLVYMVKKTLETLLTSYLGAKAPTSL